nr:uncharacterized protein LOC109188615 [Ipomoea batatas]GMC77611.1 uncharacterized protein LOC109188615 [Ipomoea batatas]
MEDIRRRLGFDYLFTVDSVGLSGGLALIWKKELEISILSHSVNHIDTSVRTATTSPIWRFTGFYGCLERHRRRISWALLKQLSLNNSLPWLLLGDFNDILVPEEKIGGAPQPVWLMQGFQEAIDFSGLMNFNFHGFQYTWEKGRGGIVTESSLATATPLVLLYTLYSIPSKILPTLL